MLGISFPELIPTGYVIYFFMASSNTTFDYNSKMERGLVNPTLETLEKLCSIFEISLSDMFLFLEPDRKGSEDRETVALKVGEILKGSDRKVKKLKLFLSEIL